MLIGKQLFGEGDKQVFMPGAVSDGHHQIGLACDSCHSSPLGGGEVLQQSCIDCHGEDRKKPHDSHPIAKFEDPRNAGRLLDINALECTTCHVEHKPEITAKNGVTQPRDFCVHCHADIGEERVSHAGMGFETCASAGCHNYHNNRALYTDFLLKHIDEPAILDSVVLPAREFASVLDQLADYPHDQYPVQVLSIADADVPASVSYAADILDDWAASGHAQSGANCSACHLLPAGEASDDLSHPVGNGQVWQNQQQDQSCAGCHSTEGERFQDGKHGMRLAVGLTAMTPSMARLPMKESAAHQELGCHSCHQAHSYDTRTAAVDACLGCHADEHSLAYLDSPHYRLWQAEIDDPDQLAGTGVSCASCHMPRVEYDVSDWVSRTIVDHNQSANLSPNSKMLRGSCMHCHGLEFAINAVSDPALISNNFSSSPSVVIDSMRLARELAERDRQRREQSD